MTEVRIPKGLIAAVVAICVLPVALNQLGFDFSSPGEALDLDRLSGMADGRRVDAQHHALAGSFVHTLLEWTAFCTALFTVVLAFVHFRVKGDIVTPIIGVALFWAGCMDAFHTLAADRLIEATASNQDLIPFTWAICRLFNALIVIAGLAAVMWRGASQRKSTPFLFVTIISILFGIAAYGIIHFCATSERLPQTMFPGSLITRPWDLYPLILYVLAATTLFPFFARRHRSLFSLCLWLSMAPHIATQMHMAFGSEALYDNHFNIAHFLKIVAYMVPYMGLALDYVRTHQEEGRMVSRLLNANLELANLVEQRSKVERALLKSEAKSRGIVTAAVDGIVTIDAAGIIESFNPAAEDLFGYRPEEVLGENISCLMPSPYREEHDGYLENYRITGEKKIIGIGREVVGLRKDGSIFPMELAVSEVHMGEGRLFAGIIRDITDRKEAEAALKRSLTSISLTRDAAQAANEATTAEEALQLTLDRVCAGTGWPVGHVYLVSEKGKDVLEPTTLWHLDDPKSFEAFKKITEATKFERGVGLPGRVMATAKPTWIPDVYKDQDFLRTRAAGQLNVRAGFAFPVVLRDKVIAVLEFFSQDYHEPDETILNALEQVGYQLGRVFERKIAEEERENLVALLSESNDSLEESNAQLLTSNRELEEFAFVASHDLQEPLRKIQTFGDRLHARFADGLGDRGQDYLNRMQNAAGRMQTLIRDLLSYSRVTTEAKPFDSIDLNAIAREVISDLEGRLADTDGRIDLGELPTLDADATQMRQLVQNLIGNALKYHKPDVPPVVTIRSSEVSESESFVPSGGGPLFQISFADNGIGFEMRHSERIFGVFQRLHGRGEYEGTGVGLALCRKIVERHGGTLTCSSAPGEGTTFVATLPARHARPAAESSA